MLPATATRLGQCLGLAAAADAALCAHAQALHRHRSPLQVYVQGDYLAKLPPLSTEAASNMRHMLEMQVRGNMRDNSRMGHYITLTPQLNGMTVALGDLEPWQTP
jgi:hypothetical protein